MNLIQAEMNILFIHTLTAYSYHSRNIQLKEHGIK